MIKKIYDFRFIWRSQIPLRGMIYASSLFNLKSEIRNLQ